MITNPSVYTLYIVICHVKIITNFEYFYTLKKKAEENCSSALFLNRCYILFTKPERFSFVSPSQFFPDQQAVYPL